MLPAIYGQLAAAQNAAALNDPALMHAAALAQQTTAVTTAGVSAASNGTAGGGGDTTPTGSRDTMYTKIFVGGLPYHTTDKTLHDYFAQFGDIEEAVVITDRQTQKSRGYGFVTMKERADAEKATRDPNPIIDGRKANVNLAYLGAKPRNNVQLAALSTLQLPLQTQLQAAGLFPNATTAATGRLGLPLIFPGAGASGNPLLNPLTAAQLQPAIAAAIAQQQAAQQAHFVAVSQAANSSINAFVVQQQQQQAAAAAAAAAAAQQHHPSAAAAYFDYSQALAAAAAAQQQHQQQQQHNGGGATGLEQVYGYPYGVISAGAAGQGGLQHLTAAAQAQLVAASGAGQIKLDNQH